MQSKKFFAPTVIFLSLLLTSCGNWNIKSGTSGIAESSTGQIDNDTGDIIRQEKDEDGRMRDCTVGNSSERRDLPSCNDIVNRREAKGDQDSQISDGLLANKLAGSKSFTLPNGAKINIKTSTKFNDESQELIINATVEKVSASDSVFQNLFINRGARIEIIFIADDDTELLTPLNIPLNIVEGQSKNIRYRKKFGQTTSQVTAIIIQARRPIDSIREYKQLARLDVSFLPN